MAHSVSWADFYLVCFAIGFCFSFFSFVFGGARTGRLHVPPVQAHGSGHVPSLPGPAGHGAASSGQPAGTAGAQVAGRGAQAHTGSGVSPFNFASIMAFLAWFGGAGYLLTRYSGLWVGLGLLISVTCGLFGGGIMFMFLTRVLIAGEQDMNPADYEMAGVLGRVSSPIRQGGTGELVYTQMGTRRVCGARSEDGKAVAKDAEVVVTRYEKGIAYVRLWSEISGNEP
jgi:hypothetical protein